MEMDGPKKAIWKDNDSVDFETFVRAAMETGPPPGRKPKAKKTRKNKRKRKK